MFTYMTTMDNICLFIYLFIMCIKHHEKRVM